MKEISSQYIPWKIGIVVKKNSYKTHALQAFFKIVSDSCCLINGCRFFRSSEPTQPRFLFTEVTGSILH
jgi:hypothetical protein